MITEQPIALDTFHGLLNRLYDEVNKAGHLEKNRSKAWNRFLELGVPTRKNEVYQYVPLTNLYSQRFELVIKAKTVLKSFEEHILEEHILPECSNSVLVFVNGCFSNELSRTKNISSRIVISDLDAAMPIYSGFINNQWAKTLKDVSDPFSAINGALHTNGLFLYFPPKTLLESPIQLLNLIDAPENSLLIMPRIQAFVGAQSEISLVATHAVLSGTNYAINMAVDLSLEEGAHCKYTQVGCNIANHIWYFDSLHATLKRNSTLKTVAVTKGAATIRYDYNVALIGENAEANLNGVWMLSDKRQAHTHVFIDHQAPQCRSNQLFKGVLNDSGRSSFEGKIMVRQAAQKTEAFQLNQNLLLSNQAHADSKPNLEIFADDVKASHGSTVGQLDQEEIFYMRTRGFDEMTAKKLLVKGFCLEIIEMVPIPSLRKHLGNINESFA